MKEVGIIIGVQNSKEIREDMSRESDKAVNMGCVDKSEYPMLFINNVIDWGLKIRKASSLRRCVG